MKPETPKIPSAVEVEDFERYARASIDDERPEQNLSFCGEKLLAQDFAGADFRASRFKNCVFERCDFKKSCFRDVVFSSCNFSSAVFNESFFERCEFENCKLTGATFNESILKHTQFSYCDMSYISLDDCKITAFFADNSDFFEASVSGSVLKNFDSEACRFVRTNFFKTPLNRVDFTRGELSSPVVSYPPAELKGSVMTSVQFSELASLLGVVLKDA